MSALIGGWEAAAWLCRAPDGAASTTRKIERLLALGFSQSEVAQVVGKKLNYVTAVVAMKKSAGAKKQKKQSKTKVPLALPSPDDSLGSEE